MRLATTLYVMAAIVGVARATEPAPLLTQAISAACEPSPTLEQLAARLPGSTVAADEPEIAAQLQQQSGRTK